MPSVKQKSFAFPRFRSPSPEALASLSTEILERGQQVIADCRSVHAEMMTMLQDNDDLLAANQKTRRNLARDRKRRRHPSKP